MRTVEFALFSYIEIASVLYFVTHYGQQENHKLQVEQLTQFTHGHESGLYI